VQQFKIFILRGTFWGVRSPEDPQIWCKQLSYKNFFYIVSKSFILWRKGYFVIRHPNFPCEQFKSFIFEAILRKLAALEDPQI